jgi:cellulose synthase/poly-beta-1,6-N-acetylglucosamine synthase-like glycosyltransferase
MLVPIIVFWTAWALVLYTYVGFPLLLGAIARYRARHIPTEAEYDDKRDLPRVTMVIAAYNEAHVIAEKLENCWKIDYPADRFEVIVGSDGSSDGTDEILRSCTDPRLRSFIFSERRGKISVLNELMEHVNSDVVVMSDANTIYAPDAVDRIVAPFRDPIVGCVSGELCLEQEGGVSGEGLYWKYESWIKRNESRLGFLIGCNGGIFAIRRGLYEPLPSSTIVEDFVLSMRILEGGHQIRFVPGARATEPACSSSRAEMVRKIRIGAGGFQALALTRPLLSPKYGLRSFAYWGHKVLRWFVPHALVAALISNLFLIGARAYAALLLGQVAGAALGFLAYNARPGRGLPRWTRPISYFYLMNFALLRGFFRFLSGTQRVTWERAPGASRSI